MKESLLLSTGHASASRAQIGANSESTDRQISALDTDLLSSSSAIRDIAESVATLDCTIRQQLTRVVTVDVVKRIDESVGNIKEITHIIDGISAQTNLLAMSAAIESAHAGGAGRGFSMAA